MQHHLAKPKEPDDLEKFIERCENGASIYIGCDHIDTPIHMALNKRYPGKVTICPWLMPPSALLALGGTPYSPEHIDTMLKKVEAYKNGQP